MNFGYEVIYTNDNSQDPDYVLVQAKIEKTNKSNKFTALETFTLLRE